MKNKVILIGRLGKDPETKVFPDGNKMSIISVATTQKWKDKATGEPREKTEWHRVVTTGPTAEYLENYGVQGDLVSVEGSITYREYKTDEGEDKSITEIKSRDVSILTFRKKDVGDGDEPAKSESADQPKEAKVAEDDFTEDDDLLFIEE